MAGIPMAPVVFRDALQAGLFR